VHAVAVDEDAALGPRALRAILGDPSETISRLTTNWMRTKPTSRTTALST
jgi:hypothetical protein